MFGQTYHEQKVFRVTGAPADEETAGKPAEVPKPEPKKPAKSPSQERTAY